MKTTQLREAFKEVFGVILILPLVIVKFKDIGSPAGIHWLAFKAAKVVPPNLVDSLSLVVLINSVNHK